MELLLSACSTYNNKVTLPGKQKRAVYAAITVINYVDCPLDNNVNGEYVDTDVSDVMVNSTRMNRFCRQNPGDGKLKSNFLTREEWNKLTQDQKDQLITKRWQ
jgi:hypothetical protein